MCEAHFAGRAGPYPASLGPQPSDGPFCKMLNPLRSEQEAFRFLLYAMAVIGAIVALVLILRAIF